MDLLNNVLDHLGHGVPILTGLMSFEIVELFRHDLTKVGVARYFVSMVPKNSKNNDNNNDCDENNKNDARRKVVGCGERRCRDVNILYILCMYIYI